jgi:hypothetical protein
VKLYWCGYNRLGIRCLGGRIKNKNTKV